VTFGIIVLSAMILSACGLFLPFVTPDPPTPPVMITPPPGIAPTLPAMPEQIELYEFDVVEDLRGMSLIDHDLADSTILEPIDLTTVMTGRGFAAVTVITYGELFTQNGFIANDAWAIEIYYFARRHESAVEAVAWSANRDKTSDYFSPDSVLITGPIRASEDHQMAFTMIAEERRDGLTIICLYLAQNVPGTDEVVVMDIVMFPFLWERHDDVVLAELSDHLGIDLSVYIAEYLDPDGGPVGDV